MGVAGSRVAAAGIADAAVGRERRVPSRVAVGLSGGVDSAVAAYLLAQRGYDVFGVFAVNVDPAHTPGATCRWQEDYESARAVARHLGIPLYVWNFEAEYRRLVLDDFYASYRRGLTPNPDVWCNERVKFGLLQQQALAAGANYLATGHYARISRRRQPSGQWEYGLLRGRDRGKDQSYFLYRLGQRQLARALFPLGGYRKPDVRQLAARAGLPNAGRPDSQGICFVGEVKLKDFLAQRLPQRVGYIVDERGRKLGQHGGAWFYTVGQRYGLGLAGGPWYVYRVEARRNVVRVTANPRSRLLSSADFNLADVHWVSGRKPTGSVQCTAEVRYHQARPRRATVRRRGRLWHVHLSQAERAVTPGQHAVLYSGQRVLGGGAILPSRRG